MLNKINANDYCNAVDKYNDKKSIIEGQRNSYPQGKRCGVDLISQEIVFFSGDANM